jgi:hypothetical protein
MLGWIYVNLLGFSSRTSLEEIAHSQRRCAQLSFRRIEANAARLRELGTPTFMAWTTDDPLIQNRLEIEFSQLLPRGPRLEYEFGGHYSQKHHAAEIAHAMRAWTEESVLHDHDARL